MTEKQSLWEKVVFIEQFSESANTTDERKNVEETIDTANTTRERESIKEIIDRAGSKFSTEPFDRRPATNIEAVREAIRDAEKVQNAIVHFSGHSQVVPYGGVVIPQYELKEGLLRPQDLSPFFKGAKNIKCVIFNFCDSLEFAKGAAEYVQCAIGIDGTIASEAAIGFAQGFYEYLRDTKPNKPDVFDEAFGRGKSASVGDDRQKFEIFLSKAASEPNAEIIKPEEETIVPRECECSGTFRNLPENFSMWLYVYATMQRKFYLFPIDEYSTNEGTWKKAGKYFTVGMEEDNNSYIIGGIIADEKVTSDLNKIFSETGREVCLGNLPSGTIKFGKRVVHRR